MPHVLDEDSLYSVGHGCLVKCFLQLVRTFFLLLCVVVFPAEIECHQECYDEQRIGEQDGVSAHLLLVSLIRLIGSIPSVDKRKVFRCLELQQMGREDIGIFHHAYEITVSAIYVAHFI